MAEQSRYEPLEGSTFFADGRSSRPLPTGTIARGQLNSDPHFYAGMQGGELATTLPMTVTRALLERGQERFNIFCSPCHDRVGTGKGTVALRGFRRMPASFHDDRLKQVPPGYLYYVISNGFGVMDDYAAQVKPEDRWAIVAYIRALQFSQDARSGRSAG